MGLFRQSRVQALEYLDLLLLQDPSGLLTGVVPSRRYTCTAHQPRRPDVYPQLGPPDLAAADQEAEDAEEIDLSDADFDLEAWRQSARAAAGVAPGIGDAQAIPLIALKVETLVEQDPEGATAPETAQITAWLIEAKLWLARGDDAEVARLVLRAALLLDHANTVRDVRRLDAAQRRQRRLREQLKEQQASPQRSRRMDSAGATQDRG